MCIFLFVLGQIKLSTNPTTRDDFKYLTTICTLELFIHLASRNWRVCFERLVCWQFVMVNWCYFCVTADTLWFSKTSLVCDNEPTRRNLRIYRPTSTHPQVLYWGGGISQVNLHTSLSFIWGGGFCGPTSQVLIGGRGVKQLSYPSKGETFGGQGGGRIFLAIFLSLSVVPCASQISPQRRLIKCKLR